MASGASVSLKLHFTSKTATVKTSPSRSIKKVIHQNVHIKPQLLMILAINASTLYSHMDVIINKYRIDKSFGDR